MNVLKRKPRGRRLSFLLGKESTDPNRHLVDVEWAFLLNPGTSNEDEIDWDSVYSHLNTCEVCQERQELLRSNRAVIEEVHENLGGKPQFSHSLSPDHPNDDQVTELLAATCNMDGKPDSATFDHFQSCPRCWWQFFSGNLSTNTTEWPTLPTA